MGDGLLPLLPSRRQGTHFSPGDWSWSIGLDDFKEHDPSAVIGSPRSLKALAEEGIEQKEIIYQPLERFQQPGVDPVVAQLRHDFFDARRQDLLTLARRTRLEIIAAERGRPQQPPETEMQMVRRRLAGPDFADCPRTTAFFKHWQHEFSPSRAAEKVFGRQSEGEPELYTQVQALGMGLALALSLEETDNEGDLCPKATIATPTSPGGLSVMSPLEDSGGGGASGVAVETEDEKDTHQVEVEEEPEWVGDGEETAHLLSPSAGPSVETLRLDPFSPVGRTVSLSSSVSEPLLRSKLEELSAVPQRNHVDEELVRKTKDILLTQRKLDVQRQRAAHEEELHTVQKLKSLERSCRRRALENENRQLHMRQYRSEMFDLNEDERTQAFRHYRNVVMSPDGFDTLLSPQGSQLMSTLMPAMRTRRGSPPRKLQVPNLRTSPTGAEKALQWERHVRKKNVEWALREAEQRMSLADTRTRMANERRERVTTDNTARSMIAAEQKLQSRISWRQGYNEVQRRKEAFEEEKAQKLQRKQQRFDQWMQQSDNSAQMRKELNNLRNVHRLCGSHMRHRKQEYQTSLQQARERGEPSVTFSSVAFDGGWSSEGSRF